jgi:hypothetical protein
MRYCTECGMPLQLGMTVCPKCGKYTPDPTQKSTNMDARTVAAATPSTYQVPFTSTPPMSPPPPATPGYSSAQPYPQQVSPQSYMPYAQSPYTTPTLQSYPTSKPKSSKRISKGTATLLIIMALVMMTGGVALIYYAAIAQPAQFRAQATATVQSILTSNAHVTATVQAQAQAHATATAIAHSQARATATVLQNTYNTATSGTPALTSSLAFQNGANWDIYDAVGGGGCAFTGNALHASIFKQHTYVPCFAQATTFSNFAFQAQMTIVKGDSGGLVFRADDANTKFYLFRVTQDGILTLLVIKDAKTDTPLVEDTNPVIKTGRQTNLLTVIAQGGTIYMYVNKQFVGSTNDTTYTSGKIGIFADDTTTATDVAFSNVSVWTL